MTWREPYLIPAELFEDSQILTTAKLAYSAISRHPKKSNTDLAGILGITPRALMKLKAHLAKCGYLEKIILGSGIWEIKYIPINSALKAHRKIDLYLSHGRTFKYSTISSQVLNRLQNKDPERLLYVISVLEWQYLNTEKACISPEKMILACFKKNITPANTWKEGWLEERLERRARLKVAKEAEKQKREAEKADTETDLKFQEWLNHAGSGEIKKLTEAAIKRSNGSLPREDGPLRDIALKIAMQKIWEGEN